MISRFWVPAALLVAVTGSLLVHTDAVPGVARAETGADTLVLLAGEFRGVARDGRGRAEILRLRGDRLMARLIDVSAGTGADLRVYLLGGESARDAGDLERVGFIDLGPFRADGTRLYPIRANTPLSRVRAIAIWDRRANINHATAELRRP